ncbi:MULTISPECIES: riboflavin synthase [Brevibacterium]|jgi:riboflavin synthase|uniref:Riboflavin synthase n=1 Tax=Brevibacterium salitolerans TaxID=1403566 RepID=A0ABN2WHH1_9MICO|nr:riboflavin synthase [Brevibacterium sp.]
MFTGIIEEKGTVTSLTRTEHGSAILIIRAGAVLAGLPEGGSLAVNGVCLTQAAAEANAAPAATTASAAEQVPPEAPGAGPAPSPDTGSAPEAATEFRAHVMGETLDRTTIGTLAPGDTVNLERCPRAGDRFDGHIVQGHVDGTGEVLAKEDLGDWVRLRVSLPARLAPFTAEKGSIALDGISLTLTAVSPPATQPHWVEVGLIPATLAATRMGDIRPGDPVNIEVDVMAKYAARLAEFDRPAGSHPATTSGDASHTHEGAHA